MSDERLRTLERAWLESRDLEAEVAYLQEALRVGHLTRVHLGAAAYLGNEASTAVLGGDVPGIPGVEAVPDYDLAGEGLPERWAAGLRQVLSAFDGAADRPPSSQPGGQAFFADLAERVAGRDPSLDAQIGAAQAQLLAGQQPDTAALTQILYLATSKHVVEALGDDVSAITERLLNFAEVEVTASTGYTGLGPVATQLAARACLAIQRLVVGTPSAKLLDRTRRVQRLLEKLRYDVGMSRDDPWYEHVPELTVLQLELADLTLRGQAPAWKPWLDQTEEWFGEQVGGVDDDAYYCVTAGADLVYVVYCAARAGQGLEELQAAVRDAVLPLLLRRGTDPLLDAPLPWLAGPGPDSSSAGTTRRFEHGGSKFWEITLAGTGFSVRYGKLGAKGRTQTKAYATAEDATREAEKKIREKTRKGYVEVPG